MFRERRTSNHSVGGMRWESWSGVSRAECRAGRESCRSGEILLLVSWSLALTHQWPGHWALTLIFSPFRCSEGSQRSTWGENSDARRDQQRDEEQKDEVEAQGLRFIVSIIIYLSIMNNQLNLKSLHYWTEINLLSETPCWMNCVRIWRTAIMRKENFLGLRVQLLSEFPPLGLQRTEQLDWRPVNKYWEEVNSDRTRQT